MTKEEMFDRISDSFEFLGLSFRAWQNGLLDFDSVFSLYGSIYNEIDLFNKFYDERSSSMYLFSEFDRIIDSYHGARSAIQEKFRSFRPGA